MLSRQFTVKDTNPQTGVVSAPVLIGSFTSDYPVKVRLHIRTLSVGGALRLSFDPNATLEQAWLHTSDTVLEFVVDGQRDLYAVPGDGSDYTLHVRGVV